MGTQRLSRPLTFRSSQGITIVIGACLLVFGVLGAHGQKIDSLKSLLPNKSGLDRANLLYQLAFEYIDVDNYLANKYSGEAFDLAISSGDSLLLVKAGRVCALALARLHREDSSIAMSLRILSVARMNNYDHELKHILNRLGAGYSLKGNYDSALIYNFESLAMRENIGDPFEISVALNNIGTVYYNLTDYDKALSFYHRSLEYKEKMHIKYDLDVLLLNISLCYSHKGKMSTASEIAEIHNICKDDCSDYVIMSAHYGSGVIQFKRGNSQEALKEFSESLALAKKLRNERFELDNIIYLSQISLGSNQLALAEKYLGEAEVLMKRGVPFNLELVKIYSELFHLYEKLGDYKKVAFYQSKYIQLNDSIYSEEVTTNLMKVEADYMERENTAKIETQGKILALQNDVISRQRMINIFVAIAAVLSIVLVVVLVQNVKQKKRANLSLELKVKERTVALETHKVELLKSLEERNQQMKRISTEIKSSVATIQGLCKLSLQDVSVVNAGEYIDRIEKTSHSLQSGIHRTLGMVENSVV